MNHIEKNQEMQLDLEICSQFYVASSQNFCIKRSGNEI